MDINGILPQMDRTAVYRTFHPCTLVSEARGTFSKIDHALDSKENLNKQSKIEIAFYILSDDKK